ncbi:hypothetical protein HPP92_014349 [Vanilla planifolia]|uniref:Uncharacterized protein n=1 Tax=Vanilla planifolia TaxID=51239 RepID=A0A835QU96_VANPL|nr:hypothetical protein HPP92_014349 [Vanilla planifolia]
MGDPFASVVPNCLIPPEVVEALRYAPCLDGTSSADASLPNIPSASRSQSAHPKESLNKEALRTTRHDPNEPCSSLQAGPPVSDFDALIKSFSEKADRRSARKDILEIAESKGIYFPPPKWWRAGGYGKRS